MTVVIETRGLDALQALFEQLPDVAEEAARLAVNDTARYARRLGSKKVRDEIAFRPRYMGNDEDGALSKEKVLAELHDYSVLLDIVPKVYDEVTEGHASKPFTVPEVRASAMVASGSSQHSCRQPEMMRHSTDGSV